MCPGTFSGYQEIQACVSPASPVSQQAQMAQRVHQLPQAAAKIVASFQ